MITRLKNYKSKYNGHEIKWFIGDIGFQHAVDIGDVKWITDKKGNTSGRITNMKGFIWEAWGSFNGRAYQLFAYCSRKKRRWWQFWFLGYELVYIKDPIICCKEGDHYFDKETYDLLSGSHAA